MPPRFLPIIVWVVVIMATFGAVAQDKPSDPDIPVVQDNDAEYRAPVGALQQPQRKRPTRITIKPLRPAKPADGRPPATVEEYEDPNHNLTREDVDEMNWQMFMTVD